jgi:sporulation protein YlmC with PRC-barrel domain
MLRPTALILAVCFGTFAEAQDAPPAQPRTPPSAPSAPGGEAGGAEAGVAGAPTRVPELLARTPDVARVSTLLGAEILDESSEPVGRLDDFVARPDGRLVAIVERTDGRRIGLPLQELIARAKPDLEGGSERATIRSFKLARVSRHLEAAPAVEDKSHLDDAWLARLDAGTPGPPAGSEHDAAEEPHTPESDAAPADAPPPAPRPLALLSVRLGRPALDPAGEPIGTVVDVVVAVPKARIAYLVVSQKPAGPDGPEAFHAVPFEALASGGGDDGVRLTIGSAELQSSPGLASLAHLPVDPLAAATPAAPAPR